MEFLAQNWFYILFLVLFAALHLFGGCGHHGGKHGHGSGHGHEHDPEAEQHRRAA